MQETENSKSEWDAFKRFEERMHREFFLPQYKRLHMEVIQDEAAEKKPWERKSDWDVKVRYKGVILTIDEKARSREWQDFAVEVMQCLKTGKTGWLYHPISYVFYAVWPSLESTGDPKYAYLVRMPDLRDFIATNFDRLGDIISEKGYGISLNKRVMWHDLEYLKLVTKVI